MVESKGVLKKEISILDIFNYLEKHNFKIILEETKREGHYSIMIVFSDEYCMSYKVLYCYHNWIHDGYGGVYDEPCTLIVMYGDDKFDIVKNIVQYYGGKYVSNINGLKEELQFNFQTHKRNQKEQMYFSLIKRMSGTKLSEKIRTANFIINNIDFIKNL
jgi:hypothetical protein